MDHPELITTLIRDFSDGWALSCHTPSLRMLLPLCPPATRVLAWVKPWAVFRPYVGVAYAWEPVLCYGGRPRTREQATVRDWHAANITLQRGLIGAKPASFCRWILDVLNVQPGDEIVDLYPGTGILGSVVTDYLNPPMQLVLVGTEPL